MTVGRRDCYPKNTLHCHRMAAITPIMEETTGTVPFTVIVVSGVDIVFAPKRRLKASELNALRLFGVAFGFGDFVNHA